MKLNSRIIIGIAALAIIVTGTIAFDIYPGGAEIGSALSSVQVDDSVWYPSGQHNWPSDDRSDVDGDFEDVEWWGMAKPIDTSIIQKPGVTIESSYPYYLEELRRGLFDVADKASIAETYEMNYTVNGQNYIYRYNRIPYGVDITIKTDGDKFYKDAATFGVAFYGYDYESLSVDVNVLLNFGLSPWAPRGIWNGTYSIVGGWAGVMQAQVYDIEYGVLENEQLEQDMEELDGAILETGIVCQDLNSINSALNMYIPGTSDSYREIDFESPDAIVGVKNAVNIEVGAKLGAGSAYVADFWGHTAGLAVRNVFVTYRLVVYLVCTLKLLFIASGSPLSTPAEGNTAGDPPPTPVLSWWQIAWDEFWADILEDPAALLMIIVVLILIAGVIYFVIRLYTGPSRVVLGKRF